jgi:hypothetical protein
VGYDQKGIMENADLTREHILKLLDDYSLELADQVILIEEIAEELRFELKYEKELN